MRGGLWRRKTTDRSTESQRATEKQDTLVDMLMGTFYRFSKEITSSKH